MPARERSGLIGSFFPLFRAFSSVFSHSPRGDHTRCAPTHILPRSISHPLLFISSRQYYSPDHPGSTRPGCCCSANAWTRGEEKTISICPVGPLLRSAKSPTSIPHLWRLHVRLDLPRLPRDVAVTAHQRTTSPRSTLCRVHECWVRGESDDLESGEKMSEVKRPDGSGSNHGDQKALEKGGEEEEERICSPSTLVPAYPSTQSLQLFILFFVPPSPFFLSFLRNGLTQHASFHYLLSAS